MASEFEAVMEKFLEEFNAKSDEDFSKEFMSLKSQSQKYKETSRYPSDSGQLSTNRKKNRFKDILPFEYTRVELHPVEGVNGSDYINANYILGSDGEISYIASQGPLPNTVEDFWRMLWYHNIEVVVMACREVEMGKKKCEMYWPVVQRSVKHGAITITTVKEESISNDFVIRDFSVECQGETQSIRQYHYNAWPDHGKPSSPDPIIRMIEMINDFRKRKEVPLVVHCSAGCGRTGTLIGIDIARAQLLSKNVPEDFSVYKIVEKMRQQRPAMVQAKDQYSFVYAAIAELSRRATGHNPTLPPKPATKPVPAAPKMSYMNIDTDNPGSSGSHASSHTPNTLPPSSLPTPTSATAKVPGKHPLPPSLPQKQSPTATTEEHLYQNISPSTSSSGIAAIAAVTDDPTEAHPPGRTLPVSPRPLGTQRSVSSASSSTSVSNTGSSNSSSSALIVERASEDDKVSQSQPMPKPRPRSKRNNNSSSAPPSSSNSASSLPPATPTVQPPQTLSKPLPVLPPNNRQPPAPAAPAVKPAPPALRNKPSSSRVENLPPLTEKPPRLPDRVEVSPPVSPSHAVLSGGGKVMVQHTKDEDEFGYGLVNVVETKPPVPKSPRPTRTEPAPKTSLMDTFRDILGDEIVQSVEEEDEAPPPLPPFNPESPKKHSTTSRPLPVCPAEPLTSSLELPDDLPPEIPCRTDARLELNDDVTYEMPGAMPPRNGPGRFPPGGPAAADYDQPVPPSKSQTASGPLHMHKSPPPSSSSSLSTPSTFNRSGNHSSSHLGGFKGANKLGSIFHKLNKKQDKKKSASSVEDLTSSTIVPRAVSSSKSSSQSSLEKNIDEKYKFPGPLGYGIRLDRPAGPREEPHHWKSVPVPSAIKVT